MSEDLRQAARWWTRRRYHVSYADAGLVQLSRTTLVYRESIAPFAAAAVLGALAVALIALGVRRRAWHVVSITVTPDHRIITHRQWTRRPVRS